MADQPEIPNAPSPSESAPPEPKEPSDVDRIRDDLFYGFRSYHTPIREQKALVEGLIDAARLEGRESRMEAAVRDELRSLFHRLRASVSGAEGYDDAAWTRFAELLRVSGVDPTFPSPESHDS